MSQLNVTDTNSANDSKGRAFGLEGNNFVYLLIAFVVAMAVFLVGTAILHKPAVIVLLVAAPLFAGPLAYILFLRHEKPEGFAADWFSQQTTGGHFSDSRRPLTRKDCRL